MIVRGVMALLLGAAMIAAPTAAQNARRAPSAKVTQRDWSRIVAATPEGGFRMGNPDAPLKLVEYGSITCNHCADFNAEGGPALRNSFVRSGKLSWEFRPLMIFPTDPGVFLLLKCMGPAGFFGATDHLYRQQSTWVGKLQGISPAEQARIDALPPLENAGALARASGADVLLRQRGLTPQRASACLADRRAMDRLAETTRSAGELGVTGTPSFLINGRLLEGVHSWSSLEPRLRKGG